MKRNLLTVINILLVVLLSTTILFILQKPSFADVGSFESYDSYSSDWGSDWSSYDYDYDYDYDNYDYDYDYDYDSSLGYSNFSFGGYLGFIILISIVIFVFKSIYKGKMRNKNLYEDSDKVLASRRPKVNTNMYGLEEKVIVEKIKENDELFNEEKFKSWSKDIFIKLQESWMNRNWNTIRAIETTELFEMHQKQLQGYIDNHQINIMERICVKTAEIADFSRTGGNDVITVLLRTKMIDYIIDDRTKEMIRGNSNTEIHSTYKMVFIRKTGIKTNLETKKIDAKNCPNCGAPTEITTSGKCEYCGSIINIGEFDWMLSSLEKMY